MGRRGFQFTVEDRERVRAWSQQGMAPKEIAAELGCSLTTVRRYFRDVLVRQPSGVPPIEFTPEQRDMVSAMTGFGIGQKDIAGVLQISTETLRAHFAEELQNGVTLANARVATSLFQMATSGGQVAAAIFWLKVRAGWKDPLIVGGRVGHDHRHEHEHEVRFELRDALERLSPEARRAFKTVLLELAPDAEEDGNRLEPTRH